MNTAMSKQKSAVKRSLHAVVEYFELIFHCGTLMVYKEFAGVIDFQQAATYDLIRIGFFKKLNGNAIQSLCSCHFNHRIFGIYLL